MNFFKRLASIAFALGLVTTTKADLARVCVVSIGSVSDVYLDKVKDFYKMSAQVITDMPAKEKGTLGNIKAVWVNDRNAVKLLLKGSISFLRQDSAMCPVCYKENILDTKGMIVCENYRIRFSSKFLHNT